ncbi:MAG: hypothetical protein JWM59_4522 [Verrucomicrobiales bacterium]|nr:hypothetical protein [Verrucomicrobiales bacterium]
MQHVHRQIVSLSRWKPVVITQKRENADRFPFPQEHRRVAVLPPPRWKNLRRFWFRQVRRVPVVIPHSRVRRLLHEVMRLEGEVVHVFFGHIAVQLLPFLQACPRPVVVSFHGADVGVDAGHGPWREALREVFRCSTLVLARSESLLEGLRELGCPPEKLRLQRTGIPLDAWPFAPRTPPADGAWHFVQACRLVPKKGLWTTLRAFGEIAKSWPRARLTLAGGGPLLAELQASATAAGLADRVAFPGFLDQSGLRDLIHSGHFFFHPSETPADGNREGVPNALLEAMASGMPALATRHGGIPEAVTHGVSGFLVEEGDAAALAQAALKVLPDPARYSALARAAREEVEAKFERARQTEILEGFYDEALELARARLFL